MPLLGHRHYAKALRSSRDFARTTSIHYSPFTSI